jgi:hypothetical protein
MVERINGRRYASYGNRVRRCAESSRNSGLVRGLNLDQRRHRAQQAVESIRCRQQRRGAILPVESDTQRLDTRREGCPLLVGELLLTP